MTRCKLCGRSVVEVKVKGRKVPYDLKPRTAVVQLGIEASVFEVLVPHKNVCEKRSKAK